MRKNRLVKPGLAAAVAAAAVIASLLALASGGQAASPNICQTASTDSTNASCVGELVAPHVLTAGGGDGVSITSFKNEAGVGGATATHVVLNVTFKTFSVTVKSIKVLVNGGIISSSCTTASGPPTVVSCPVGNIIGGSKALMIVRFSTVAGGTLEGSATYGEGGNDSLPPRPNGTANDTQKARDSLAIATGGAAQGNCFDATQFVKGLVTVSGSTSDQATTGSVGQADSSLSLPCSPASAGVDTDHTHRPSAFTEDVSFVEFMKLPSDAVGTVTIAFSSVPDGFVLKELQVGMNPTDPDSWTQVPTCASNSSGTSCIVSRKAGGTKYILNVRGSSVDPRYGG